MSDAEKQESQKTVVAFITGLLIGGLLVWVFSSSPDEVRAPEVEEVETEQESDTKIEDNEEDERGAEATTTQTSTRQEVTIGEGSITVNNQSAGRVVTLGAMEFPTEEGWIVVRDLINGMPGNVLGAARYSTADGLVPTTVNLMRNTTAGNDYRVVYYTNEGSAGFTIGEDRPIDGIGATFRAQ